MAELYQVVSTHETTELTPAGSFQDVLEVTAVSNVTGSHTTIRLPISQASPENVRRLLDARFDSLHAIHEL